MDEKSSSSEKEFTRGQRVCSRGRMKLKIQVETIYVKYRVPETTRRRRRRARQRVVGAGADRWPWLGKFGWWQLDSAVGL